MTRVDLTRKLLIAEKERDVLREVNCKLRDKLLEVCKQCRSCDGTGIISFGKPPIIDDCPACVDLREVLQSC
jgi:hypothetical protein